MVQSDITLLNITITECNMKVSKFAFILFEKVIVWSVAFLFSF
jgi:hypothetical protein